MSRNFPLDFDRATHGIFQRLRMFLRAACQAADTVDALFFVPAAALEYIDVARYEQLLLEQWSVAVRLRFAPMAEHANRRGGYYVLPALGIRYNEDFSPTTGECQARAVAAALVEDTQLLFAHRVHAALPVHAAARLRNLPPVIVDIDDLEHRKFLRGLLRPPYWLGKFIKFLHVFPIALAERRTVRRSTMSLVCSEIDRAYLQRLAGVARVAVVPNTVQFGPATQRDIAVQPAQRIVFVGAYNYGPNADAAEYLLREIFPRVRAAIPTAELVFVGAHVESLPSYGHSLPGVHFRGFVDDLAAFWGEARLMCCPIRLGGGTRIKIIESAAHGVPVVSTTIGAEGLNFENGREILLGDTPAALAEACVRVLLDDALALLLAQAARRKALQYDSYAVTVRIAGIFRQLAHVT